MEGGGACNPATLELNIQKPERTAASMILNLVPETQIIPWPAKRRPPVQSAQIGLRILHA
ncbi:hypothetical protein D3C76_1682350 [compost metagenome]